MDLEDHQSTFTLYTSWVNSLRVSLSTTLEPQDLVNCRSFAEILHRVDDRFFAEEWVEKITDFGMDSSWRLKGNNLTKVIRKVSDYIEESASRSIKAHPAWNINDQEFVELHPFKDLNKIFCLVVGCAFMGQNKQEFVNLIQRQPQDLQKLVMNCVLFIHDNSEEYVPPPPTQEVILNAPIMNGKGDSNGNSSKLVKEVDDLKLEKERLEKELDLTRQELFEYTSNRSVEQLQAENDDLRKRKEQAEDRLIDMEARIDTLSANLETKDQELVSLQDKLEQIHTFEEEFRKMRDEVGELKNKELELIRVSRELESLKQRSKHDVIDKTELNVLREKSAEYVKDMITLEDERIKTKSLRQQVASLKAQMEEKEGETNRATIRMSKLESELAETKSRLATAEKKCDDVVHEKLQMQSRIRELEHIKDPINGLNSLSSELENIEAGDRARVLDLQNEIDRLREHIRQLEPLEQSQMEWRTTKELNRELESEKQLFLQKQTEYKARIEVLETQLDAPKSNADLNQLRIQLEQQSIETKTLKERVDLYERKITNAEDDKKRLESSISELKATVEIRNEQLKKAKKLISDQEQKLSSSDDGGPTVHQFDVLRKDLEHKEKLLKHVQEQLEKSNTAHEEESRLMATSYHGMAHMMNSGERSKTFLSKQYAVSSVSVILPWSLVILLLSIAVFLALPHWFRESLRPPPLLV